MSDTVYVSDDEPAVAKCEHCGDEVVLENEWDAVAHSCKPFKPLVIFRVIGASHTHSNGPKKELF